MSTEDNTNYTFEQPGFTMQEVAQALAQIAPALDATWRQCLDDDALWRERAARHGVVRTWLLRRELRRGDF